MENRRCHLLNVLFLCVFCIFLTVTKHCKLNIVNIFGIIDNIIDNIDDMWNEYVFNLCACCTMCVVHEKL